MALELYGVTVESVRKHHFPQADAWTASSRPSEAAVGETIDECAGRLAGALSVESVAVTGLATTAAYVSCRAQLRMMVAIVISRDMLGVDPAIARAWKTEVREWFEGLDESNVAFLGDGAVITSVNEPDGPTDFISNLNLEVGDPSEASDVKPVLQRKDDL